MVAVNAPGFSYLHEEYWSHRNLHASEMWQRPMAARKPRTARRYSTEGMLTNEPLQCMIGRGSSLRR